jgi:ATP phosphoribosyltransferase regulatory subunit
VKLTPRGCRNVGGDVAMVAEDLRKDFMDTFIPYGYKPFWPAGLQLLEAITAKVNANLQNRLVVTNSFHGEPCALRADITLGVVDYCASHFEAHERPLRLCYTERIYRRPKSPDKNMERLQMGAELIGWEGEGADVELIGLLLAYLNKLNCPKIGIALGDVSLIQRAIKYLPRAYAMSLLGCLEEGKMDEYARIARDLPPSPLSIFFEELPWLKGNAEILYRASRLLKGVEEAIEPLKSIYAELVKMGYGDCIVIDLSLVRELDYYSGPIFDVYFEDTGIPIGGGGRYDTLLERHGMLGQAVGFALDLEVLALNTTKPTTEAQKILLWAQGSQPASVLACAKEITSLGYCVEILWRERAPEVSELARKRGCNLLLNLNKKSITDLVSGDETFLDDFLGGDIYD